jgi:hypothetical protein
MNELYKITYDLGMKLSPPCVNYALNTVHVANDLDDYIMK